MTHFSSVSNAFESTIVRNGMRGITKKRIENIESMRFYKKENDYKKRGARMSALFKQTLKLCSNQN